MSETPESYPQRPGRPADLSEWEIDAEQVAENPLQREIVNVLVSSLKELIAARGWKNVQVLCNTFFAWLPERPMVRVSPDVYLLDAPPKRLPGMWQTWKPENRPPFWALEILSEDWHKDYDQVPPKYEELGCRELVVFDPEAAMGRTHLRRRVPLTIYRRSDAGAFVVGYSGPGPALSPELGVWLVPIRDGYSSRLRLSEDREATRIVPTFEEGQEAERLAQNKEHARRVAAERRVAELERKLGKKRR
jgi:Uma2 family endonuclease